MGSTFEDLVARGLTVKTDLYFDKRFKSYDFCKKKYTALNARVASMC
jgi:hypothetical protein